MPRAQRPEPNLTACPSCGRPTTRALCKRCCDIGGGYVPAPPADCAYVEISPIGGHRCAKVYNCAYRCGRADCRWGKRFSRIGHEAAKTKRKVVWK